MYFHKLNSNDESFTVSCIFHIYVLGCYWLPFMFVRAICCLVLNTVTHTHTRQRLKSWGVSLTSNYIPTYHHLFFFPFIIIWSLKCTIMEEPQKFNNIQVKNRVDTLVYDREHPQKWGNTLWIEWVRWRRDYNIWGVEWFN